MTKLLVVDTQREHYSAKECIEDTITVGELMSILCDYDEDAKVVLAFDNRYTFGTLNYSLIDEDLIDEED